MMLLKKENIDTFFRDFGTWAYLRPLDLYMNMSMYRFYSSKLRRVCLSCYFIPKRVNLVNRESGIKTLTRQELKSKTHDEIREYFKDFAQFRKRKDLELCIVDEYKRREIICLDICLHI
jgi:hypothetical protein